MEQLVMPVMMVIGESDKGDSQSDAGGNCQENKGEGDRRVSLMEVHWRGCCATRDHRCQWFVAAVPQPESDCRKADADQGSGRNDRSTKCSHGFPLVREILVWDMLFGTDVTPRDPSHVKHAQATAEQEQHAGHHDKEGAAAAARIGAVRAARPI